MAEMDYYDNEFGWGDYQYVPLSEVIDNFKMSLDQDDYVSNIPRYKVLYFAKRGLRELYYDVLQEVKRIGLELGPTLTVPLPPDFVAYVRISWVGPDGRLNPLAVDNRKDISKAYLQDNSYGLLYDSEGCVLRDNNVTIEEFLDFNQDPTRLSIEGSTGASFCRTFNPNTNFSDTYLNGRYRIDKDRGVIEFGTDTEGRDIVIEYISDGLYVDACENTTQTEDRIRVHKFAEQALLDFIYYSSIKRRRNVPANEKYRARKEYYNSRRIAKRRLSKANTDEMLQAFRAQTAWVKDPGLNR